MLTYVNAASHVHAAELEHATFNDPCLKLCAFAQRYALADRDELVLLRQCPFNVSAISHRRAQHPIREHGDSRARDEHWIACQDLCAPPPKVAPVPRGGGE
eukprot:scaffold16214_cov73-Phaeocystis_antarctica.AAC.5